MVTVQKSVFGLFTDPISAKVQDVIQFRLRNNNGFSVKVMNYGATITSISYPDKHGKVDDVTLGFDTFNEYLAKNNPYFGAVVGRVANRIGHSKFKLNGKQIEVTANKPPNHLHGGLRGFDKVIWKSDVQGQKVVFTYLSPDGEEGYPGAVLVSAMYSITADNQLRLEMSATATEPTPVNLTNHSYFNLGGHGSGKSSIFDHIISVNADKYTATDNQSIPTGNLTPVGGTLWDLRIPRRLGDLIPLIPGGGYDQNLCIARSGWNNQLNFVARVVHPETSRTLEVYSNQPGVQFYTANFFPKDTSQDSPSQLSAVTDPLIGRGGTNYYQNYAFCLETQNYPDAVNHENFPDSVLKPGQTYRHIVVYKFGLFDDSRSNDAITDEPLADGKSVWVLVP